MKYFLSTLFAIISFSAFGQKGYKITYYTKQFSAVTMNHQPVEHDGISVIVFNDSFYYSYPTNTHDYMKKKKIFGNKYIHHAFLYKIGEDSSYYYNAWPKIRKPYIVAKFNATKKNEKWVIDSSAPYHYKEFSCRRAYKVDEAGDTTVAVFTTDLAANLGPYGPHGLPGFILEMYDPKYQRHYTIKKIERDYYYFRLPENPVFKDKFD